MSVSNQYEKTRTELFNLLNTLRYNLAALEGKAKGYELRHIILEIQTVETILKNHFNYYDRGTNDTLERVCKMVDTINGTQH